MQALLDLQCANKDVDPDHIDAELINIAYNPFSLFVFAVTEIKVRSVFIHVDVPGQGEDAEDIENFPTIQQLGSFLIQSTWTVQ